MRFVLLGIKKLLNQYDKIKHSQICEQPKETVILQQKSMVLNFEKEYLRELYEKGKSSDKKHRFQPEIIRAYAKCVYRLEEATTPEELYKYQPLRFEALVGDKQGLYSVRVNNQYRVEFSISKIDLDKKNIETNVTICNIVELSNHYK